MAKGNTMKADFSDRSGGGLATRPERREFSNLPLDGERMGGNDFFSKPYVQSIFQLPDLG